MFTIFVRVGDGEGDLLFLDFIDAVGDVGGSDTVVIAATECEVEFTSEGGEEVFFG